MKPVISVIVPVYNQEKYIEECLRSLLTQATDEVEFLLINDGSTDRSLALCRGECLYRQGYILDRFLLLSMCHSCAAGNAIREVIL